MTTHYIFFLTLQLLLVNIYIDASPNRQSSKELISSVTTISSPTWMGDTYCTKDSDCKIDECCIYKPDRYSIPECRKYEKKNDTCIPHASTLNTTLYYPDGSKLDLLNVHRIFCPCNENLICDKDGICSPNNIIKKPSIVNNN